MRKFHLGKSIFFFWLIALFPLIVIGGMLTLAAFSELPSFKELENPESNQASEVYAADGPTIGKYYVENRTNVNFDQLSPYLVDALVSTEDERFYQHSGIDFRSLGRVAYGVLTLNTSQGGGSTITQQLAKMLFSEPPRNIIERIFQKFQEWIIAVKLERQYTKEEIIALYLNKLDFVNNAVGIKSAANIYFNTTPDSLKIEEAALLVGMAKNPSLYNPKRRPEMTTDRRNVVFYQMMRNGKLEQAEFDSLKTIPLELKFQRISHVAGLAPYFREVLRGELKDLLSEKDELGNYKIRKPDGEPYNLYSDGLRIYTTIDTRLQQNAEEAVVEHLSKDLQPSFFKDLAKRDRYKNSGAPYDKVLDEDAVDRLLYRAIRRSERFRNEINAFVQCDSCNRTDEEIEEFKKDSMLKIFDVPVPMKVFSYEGDIDTVMTPMDSIKYYHSFLRAGLVSLDPKTGYVRAWVGGANFRHFKFDHVKLGKNQVGSTFKPFVYATAIREGLDPCMKIPNVLTCFDIPGQPRYCPKNSGGKYIGEVSLKEGLAKSMNNITAWVMKRYGAQAVTKLARDLGITSHLEPVPSLCLGVADINLLEITSANAAFANRGVHIKPVIIERIEDKNGNIIYSNMPQINEALDAKSSFLMLDMMKAVVNFGSGSRLRRNFPYGNLTQHIAGKTGTTQSNSDGWFIGLTPDLVTGVWVGGEERTVRFSTTRLGQGANMALPIFGYYMNKNYADDKIKISEEDFEWPENLNIDEESLDCGEINNSVSFEDEDFGL